MQDVTLHFPEPMWRRIVTHAQAEYPRECCGVILAPEATPDALAELIPCPNAQDRYHQRDPAQFPRDSATAYFIDPAQLLAIDRRCRHERLIIRVIYHSHPDADAFFSAEDQRRATLAGEPLYPQASYLVLSVRSGKVVDHRIFCWRDGLGNVSSRGAATRH